MPFQSLDDLTPADAARVGGKTWNCARLKQLGFPVPAGLAIPANAAESEIAALPQDPWLDRWPADERFAVRSSGLGEDTTEQSFAGIHETWLNVPRAGLLDAVIACRASTESERASAYRAARSLAPAATAAGVLIQRMIQAVAAGVAFTIDPLTGAEGELVINSAPGLGVAVVDGRIDPDEIRVRKTDCAVTFYRVGDVSQSHTGDGLQTVPADRPEGRSLRGTQIQELASLLMAIEQHYGSPQDVEWCHDGYQFWIVQSRPVTVAPSRSVDIEWTRANLAEVLPDMTSPQALAAVEELLNVAERRYMGRLLEPYEILGPMVKAFCGRLYFNLSQFRHVCLITGTPPAAVLRSMGHTGRIPSEDEAAPRPSLRQLLPRLPDLLRILGRHLRAGHVFRTQQRKMAAVMTEFASSDPAVLRDDQIWAVLAEWKRKSPESMEAVLLFGGVLFHELALRKICERVDFPFERLLYSQLATGERSVSAQQAFDLVALVEIARRDPRASEWLSRSDTQAADLSAALRGTAFLIAFEEFLERYGHRGLYETDWALPRYAEDPSPLLDAIRLHLRDARDDKRPAVRTRAEAEAVQVRSEFEQRMIGIKRWTVLPRARRLLITIKHYYVWREQCRSDLIRVMAVLRRWHLVLARRFVERGWLDCAGDYFFLHMGEIAAVVADSSRSSELRAIVARRVAEADRYRRLEMPMLMRESELPRLLRASGVSDLPDDEGVLRGVPVSHGSVEGEVVVITDPGDFARMKPGAILVTRATDPSWTPLFTLAAGVVVEVGGVLSHASTIAREYGIPALANVKHATRRLKSGERVVLNATEGFVRKVESAATVA